MRIAQLTLMSADPPVQAEFWGGRLGLPVREAGSRVEIVLHRSAIRFEPAGDGIDARYHFALNVPPGTIEQAASWLGERQDVLEFHGDPDVAEARRSSTRIAARRASTSSTPAGTSSS